MLSHCRKYLVLWLLLSCQRCVTSVNTKRRKYSKSKAKAKACKFAKPKEKTKECRRGDDKLNGNLPLCVGVRGNGTRLWAHFPALARIVEAFGPVAGYAGGSSATVTGFLFESIESNPLVVNCGKNRCCSDMEQRARISFLLKSLEAVPEASNIDVTRVLTPIAQQIIVKGIIPRLQADDEAVRDQAVDDLIAILESNQDAASIINQEVIDLLKDSPDPVYHANDILEASSGSFAVAGDPLVFIRPYLLSFAKAAELVDIAGSFYNGFDPIDTAGLETLLERCAAKSVGMEWKDIESITVPSLFLTCSELFASLYQDFANERNSSHPSRLGDPLGKTVTTLITTSVLHGEGFTLWKQASEAYSQAEKNVEFTPDFDDVSFGYFGNKKTLKRVSKKLPNDAKSNKFLSLGSATWLDVLVRSPAEPTLSRGVLIDNTQVSLGGWTDQVPAQVLTAMGCSRIVLINRPGGVGDFPKDVATLLGASQKDLDSLYELGDKESSWTAALSASDASICADWDAPPNQFDVDALVLAGYEGRFLSDSKCILSLDVGATGDQRIKGCTPLVVD